MTRHYDELSKYIDKKYLRSLQIDMLSKAGFPEKAKDCLSLVLADGISEAEESRLQRKILEAEGADPIETRKMQFKQSNSLV